MLEFTEIKKKNLERSHSFAFFCDSDFAFNILNQRLFFVCVVHFSWENMLFSQSAFRESARLKSFWYQNRFYLHAFNVTFMLHIVLECGADACSLSFFHFQYYCFFEANHPPCMRASLRGHFSGLCAVVSSASVRGKLFSIILLFSAVTVLRELRKWVNHISASRSLFSLRVFTACYLLALLHLSVILNCPAIKPQRGKHVYISTGCRRWFAAFLKVFESSSNWILLFRHRTSIKKFTF